MKQHAAGFRTTHGGSLPRPPALSDLEDAGQVKAAVEQLVRRQLEAAIEGVAGFFTLPEVERSMKALGHRSAREETGCSLQNAAACC